MNTEAQARGMSDSMPTEMINPEHADLDKLPTDQLLEAMNRQDRLVADAVHRVLPAIADAVTITADALRSGGRLIYVGAGTSGRLGIVDAAECPPTFGVSPDVVQGIIAGGKGAVFKAREGAEDRRDMGARALARRHVTAKDVICGLSTSGRTPYVLGALEYARSKGAKTIAIYCNPDGVVGTLADVAIVPVTGPEILAGSTRLKAGTAEKMVLNMLSTAVMIRLGRVSGNMMTNMQISCEKLRFRAIHMIMQKLGVGTAEAEAFLKAAGDDLSKIPGLSSS